MESRGDLMEVEALWALIDCGVSTLAPVSCELEQADGFALAQDVRAETDQPAFDRSAMDGYAILSTDNSGNYTVIGEIRPGRAFQGGELRPGLAYRIFTGAEVPNPSWRVIMQESFHAEGRNIRLLQETAENHIRRRGSDCKQGDVIVPKGAFLTPGAIAILAENGVACPLVYPSPRVFHLTTGDEIVPHYLQPGPGQIRDSNGPLIRALLKSCGVTNLHFAHAKEDRDDLQKKFEQGATADLILISGGSSVGDHDHTRWVLEKNGFIIQCSKINSRPGKPMIFANRKNQIAFGLPGNPVSHFVCFQLFVRRALASMSERPQAPLIRGRLKTRTPGKANPRVTWWPCLHDAEGVLEPLKWNNSGDLSAIARANALAKIPANAELFAGSSVQYLLLS